MYHERFAIIMHEVYGSTQPFTHVQSTVFTPDVRFETYTMILHIDCSL